MRRILGLCAGIALVVSCMSGCGGNAVEWDTKATVSTEKVEAELKMGGGGGRPGGAPSGAPMKKGNNPGGN